MQYDPFTSMPDDLSTTRVWFMRHSISWLVYLKAIPAYGDVIVAALVIVKVRGQSGNSMRKTGNSARCGFLSSDPPGWLIVEGGQGHEEKP